MDVTKESVKTLSGALRLPKKAGCRVCASPRDLLTEGGPGPRLGSFVLLPRTSILVWPQSCGVQLWTQPAMVPRGLPVPHWFCIFIWKKLWGDSLVGRRKGRKEASRFFCKWFAWKDPVFPYFVCLLGVAEGRGEYFWKFGSMSRNCIA